MNPSMSLDFVFASVAALWEICDFAPPEDKHKSEQTMAAAEFKISLQKQRNVRKRAAKVSKVIILSQ